MLICFDIFLKKQGIRLGLGRNRLWNYNTRNNISFSVRKISSTYLMILIDFNIDQNVTRRVG